MKVCKVGVNTVVFTSCLCIEGELHEGWKPLVVPHLCNYLLFAVQKTVQPQDAKFTFSVLDITHFCDETFQAFPAFLYCKQWEGPGSRDGQNSYYDCMFIMILEIRLKCARRLVDWCNDVERLYTYHNCVCNSIFLVRNKYVEVVWRPVRHVPSHAVKIH